MFVVMLQAGLIGDRWRPIGAVVEVSQDLGSRLLTEKVALPHDGPESEPEPEPEPEEKPGRQRKTERAAIEKTTEKR